MRWMLQSSNSHYDRVIPACETPGVTPQFILSPRVLVNFIVCKLHATCNEIYESVNSCYVLVSLVVLIAATIWIAISPIQAL